MNPGALLLALQPGAGAQESPRFAPRIERASDEAAQSIQEFVPAPGIAVSLFAAEPRLANPVAFHVDPRGVAYVAETFRLHQGVTDIREHMDWLDDDLAARTVEDRLAMFRKFEGENYDSGYGRAFEQVRRIVDRDGDLVADEDTVFATGFDDHAAGIGAGVLAHGDDVYYTCIPDLWRLRDADQDGVAEEQRKLSSGYGVHVALLGHDLHGLCVGPDRRLYFSCGDRGFQVETEAGTIAHPQCGAVLRCELDGSKLEVWHTGLRNPQELAFDAFGNLWTGDNNSDGGDRARWVRVVEGGDSGWRYPYQWITEPVARGPWNDEKLWHPAHDGQAAYIVPPVANLGDGPSGLTYYPGTGLTPAYDGHFFLCDFRGDASASGIHTFTVKPKGASFELGPVERFLWGSLVTDCDFGPDGALWFSDWVYGWELTGKGRLYRAFDPEAQRSALVTETRALLAKGMGGRAPEELVELLAHPDQRVRQAAHFELAERGAVDELAAVASEGPSLLARLHAIWGLGIAGRTAPKVLERLVVLARIDVEPEVRAQAIRVLGDERYPYADQLALSRLADENARVRFFAALAVGRLKSLGAGAALAKILRETGESDRDLRHAAVMGLAGCADFAALDELARDSSPHVRMGVLLALRRLRERTVARFLLDDEPRLALEAARAIHDVPIEGALESLARTRLDSQRLADGGSAFLRRVLNANYRLGRADTLASIAENETLPLEARVEALDMLAHWERPSSRDRVTNEWRPLAPRDAEGLEALAVRLAGPALSGDDVLAVAFARFAGAARARAVAEPLATLAGARERGAEVRIAALEALEAMQATGASAAMRAALADSDASVRASALERLARLAPEEALAALPAILAKGEDAERRAVYRLLAARAEPASAALLLTELESLERGEISAELALDLATACDEQGSPELRERLERRVRARSDDPVLAPWLDTLAGGDRTRGSDVFQRVELSCTRCHAWWADADERVGPNLFGLGQRLTRSQILESIVAPNRTTTPGYGARAFFLADGRVVSGRVFEEGETLVRLFDAQNTPIALSRSEIDEERADVSAMPEDLAKALRPHEMRDLVEYLAGL